MSGTAIILSVLLALVSLAAGAPKALLKGDIPASLQTHMGLSSGLVRFVGLAEVAAAAGLIVGIWWHPLGIAAAAGMTIVFVGAAILHARVGDFADPESRSGALSTVVLALVSIATIVTLALA